MSYRNIFVNFLYSQMKKVLLEKFKDPDLRQKLIDTGNLILKEDSLMIIIGESVKIKLGKINLDYYLWK